MFSFFKKHTDKNANQKNLSFKKGPLRHPYYGAHVRVENNFIHLKNDNEIDGRVQLKAIRQVSIVSYMKKHEQPEQEYWVYLKIKDQGDLHVPSLAGGFELFKKKLNDLPEWNTHKFEQARERLNAHPQIVWNAEIKVVPDAQLNALPDSPACEKLEDGLWLEHSRTLISWGSYGELAQVKGVHKVKNQWPNPGYKSVNYVLKAVTILNGLHLKELTVFGEAVRRKQKANPDWPVTAYSASPILALTGEEGFRRLYNHFTSYLGEADESSELPDKMPGETYTENEKSAVWYRGKTAVHLHITRFYGEKAFSPKCFLKITHQPDLSPFFRSDYQQNLALESVDYAVLPTFFDIPEEYIQTQNIWFTPACFAACFAAEKSGLIWLDQTGNKLGIGNAERCRIVDYKPIRSLQLEAHYWRDELVRHTLYAVHRQGKFQLLAVFFLDGDTAEMHFMQQITLLTGWSVDRTEDRQYY